jgi:hypothetical protein
MKFALLAVRAMRVDCDCLVAGIPKPMPPELEVSELDDPPL